MRAEGRLVGGGELHGERLLGSRSVRWMASNQVGDLYRGFRGQLQGMGFGYTVAVDVDPVLTDSRRSKGAFGWGGALGTRSWSDPEEELAAVIMLQQPHRGAQYDFENAVRAAIIDCWRACQARICARERAECLVLREVCQPGLPYRVTWQGGV